MTNIQYRLVDNHRHNYSDQYIYCKSCGYSVSLWTNSLEKAVSILESSKDHKKYHDLTKTNSNYQASTKRNNRSVINNNE